MAKTDFRSFMVRNVTFKFPRLGATYKFNTAEKRSEECPPRANGASYSVGWDMTAADAAKLHADLKAHYESCVTKAPFAKIFGSKKNADGTVGFSAKRNGVNGNGDENEKPKVINGMKLPLEDVNIWGGSTGNIKVTAYPVTDPDGIGGISLLIDVVQVVKAVYGGGGGLDEFDAVDAVDDPDLGDFGTADPFADVSDQRMQTSDPMDDEIPY